MANKQWKLKLERVGKNFKRGKDNLEVLRDLSFEVCEGDFLVFLGPSGCGKSTLLRIIAGLEQPTQGKVWINRGDGANKEHPELVVGPGADRAMVFQDYTSFPWLTVSENIGFALRDKISDSTTREAHIRRHIELVGLKGFENSYPAKLSGGMKQRVALARTLASNPAVLLLDEPFGALDADTRSSLQRELLRIWEEKGYTIVFVTHDIDEAVFLSDRILFLDHLPASLVGEPIMNVLPHPRASSLRLSREFADIKVEVAKRFAELTIDVGVSEWEGHTISYIARDKSYFPAGVRFRFGVSHTERQKGLEIGDFGCFPSQVLSA